MRPAAAITLAIAASAGVAACSSSPSGGGVDLPPADGACPRAVAVASSDYASSSISVSTTEGKLLRAALLTSGSRPAGASQAFSGDVVLPTTRPKSGRLVLVDRYPNSVITFVDVATGQVEGQLGVATGFPSNPHDYLETRDGRAFVTRYETNTRPGREPFDVGGDVLVVETAPPRPRIVGRIDLAQPDDGGFQPRPDRMIDVDGTAWVLLQRFDASFKGAADARIVGIDTARESVTFRVDLPSTANCGALARSPSGRLVAVACSGLLGDRGRAGERSALVVLDASMSPPRVTTRVDSSAVGGAAFAPQVGFASDGVLVAGTYGSLDDGRTDTIVTVDAVSGAVARFADVGQAFALGDIRCAPGCGACLVADARANALRVLYTDPDGRPVERARERVDAVTGLPPRYLGFL